MKDTEFIYQMNFDHRLVVLMACEITPLGSRTMQRSYGKLFRDLSTLGLKWQGYFTTSQTRENPGKRPSGSGRIRQ